jgi:hypothetical protein
MATKSFLKDYVGLPMDGNKHGSKWEVYDRMEPYPKTITAGRPGGQGLALPKGSLACTMALAPPNRS